MSLPASTHTRNSEYRHKQSIGRQRRQAKPLQPREHAELITKIVRKAIADGRPLPRLSDYRVTEDVWSELPCLLTNEEIAALNAQDFDFGDTDGEPSIDDLNETLVDDDAPIPYVPVAEPQPAHVPTWRDHEPAIVHSLKWRDTEGIEHLHVVRADNLDDMMRHITQIKALINTAKASCMSN